MRILVITYRGQEHHATETEEYSSAGRPFIVCNCGATAYGQEALRWAHNRGNHEHDPVDIRLMPEKRRGTRRIWDPPWETSEEHREELSRGLDQRHLPAALRKAIERALCRRFGHTPSRDHRVCVYCQRRRDSGGAGGKWNPPPRPPTPRPIPPPRRDPALPPPSSVHGNRPLPGPRRREIEPPRKKYRHQQEEHPESPPEDCPHCMGPPKDWDQHLRDRRPCTPHHRSDCPICARRSP